MTRDPLAVCVADARAAACAAALRATDDEFALTAAPDGFTRTGLFGTWDSSTVQSSYVVLAESAADVQAAVAFAHVHDLRVTVKGTGHGWFAGGTAKGALMVWTHRMDAISFESAFVPDGCSLEPVAVARVGPGVQFREL